MQGGPDAQADELEVCVDRLCALMGRGKTAVLTGAGCSTESGIPDYRGPGTRRRARHPIQYRQFISDARWRQRYWARAVLGWERFQAAQPNAGHEALAELEAAGRLTGLVTQNVDGLHQAAGSRNVVELHGALHEVVCLDCGWLGSRDALHRELLVRNPGWTQREVDMAPDGDAELDDVEGFEVVDCPVCGGPLKPHVVFFGEAVPLDRVDRAWSMVKDAELLLVVGSSLTVFSGYRFVKGAAKRGIPVAMLNLGTTRGDALARVRVEAKAGEVLPTVVRRLAAK